MSKIPATQKEEKASVKAKKREDVPKSVGHALEHPTLSALQNHLGNAAVQRLLAQRSGDGAFDLDDATAGRINAARGGGQALDGAVQTQMSQSMGTDFSGVRVHTGSEAHQLNEQLSAKAFTTGSDIFFREGEYNPGSSGGQELIAHELTHVVQQGSGAVSGGAGGGGNAMRVNAPGDRFEQEADSVAKNVAPAGGAPAVQRQAPEEEVQTKRLQRAEMPEEEVQAKRLQRQEMEEEEVQTKALQRQEEEEAVQMQEEDEEPVQMQELPEEEAQPA